MKSREVAFKSGKNYPVAEVITVGDDIEYTVESEVDERHLMPWDDEIAQHFEVKED
jgi:hypothetical protein